MKLGVEVEDEAKIKSIPKKEEEMFGEGSLKLTGPVFNQLFNLSHTHNCHRHEQQTRNLLRAPGEARQG